jgi:hypothetical protein
MTAEAPREAVTAAPAARAEPARAMPAELPLVGLALALGLALRVAIAVRSGFWRDEALFLGIAGLPHVRDIVSFLAFHESHPPLYYLIQRAWMRVAGTGDTAAVVPALLFGTGSIALAWRVARRAVSPAAGVAAAWVLAVSPAAAFGGAIVRPYALLGLLALLSTDRIGRAIESRDVRAWTVAGLATAGMVWVHNWGWVVVAAQVIAFGALVACRRSRGALRAAALMYAAVLASYAAWLPALARQAAHAGYPRAGGQLGHALSRCADFLLGVPAPLGPALLAVPLAAGLVPALPAAAPYLAVPLLSFAVAAAAAPLVNLVQPLCFIAMAPLLAVGIAMIATAPAERRSLRVCRAASFALFLLASSALAVGMASQRKSNAREIAAAVRSGARADDLIVLLPEFIASSFNRYFTGSNSQIAVPHAGREVIVRFDDAFGRIADSAAWRATLDSVARAREAGRGVWYVTLSGGLLRMPSRAAEPGTSAYYGDLTRARARALYERLVALYGEPSRHIAGSPRRSPLEALDASYFAPPAGAAGRP